MKNVNLFYEAPCMEIAEMQVEQCVLSGSLETLENLVRILAITTLLVNFNS